MRSDFSLNPTKCHEEFSSLQPMFPPKRFDISPPLTGSMLRRFRYVQIYTVANPACGLVNKEKGITKRESLAAPPFPTLLVRRKETKSKTHRARTAKKNKRTNG